MLPPKNSSSLYNDTSAKDRNFRPCSCFLSGRMRRRLSQDFNRTSRLQIKARITTTVRASISYPTEARIYLFLPLLFLENVITIVGTGRKDACGLVSRLGKYIGSEHTGYKKPKRNAQVICCHPPLLLCGRYGKGKRGRHYFHFHLPTSLFSDPKVMPKVVVGLFWAPHCL